MGNCLKCFQSNTTTTSSTSSSATTPAATCRGSNTMSSSHAVSMPKATTHFMTSGGTKMADGLYTDGTKMMGDRDGGRRHIYDGSHVPQETDELLSRRSPLKITTNICDISKRNSFKMSLNHLPNGGTNTNLSEKIAAVKESSHEVSDNTLNLLFEEYKDPDEEDMILTDGIERLCHDLKYRPDEFPILVLAWCLDASQMCRFTKMEFIAGLHKMRADSIDTIRVRLIQTSEMLKQDGEMFKQLYRFTFRFGLDPEQRILPLEIAIELWKVVFTVHTPPLLGNWVHFLEQHPSIRGIPKDTWNMFLNFSEQCDINNYDDTEAWPSLFDDFVDYERARLNENGAAIDACDGSSHCDDDNNNDEPQHHHDDHHLHHPHSYQHHNHHPIHHHQHHNPQHGQQHQQQEKISPIMRKNTAPTAVLDNDDIL